MLLCKDNPDTSKLTYPVYVSPKLDGIRCLVTKEGAVSRTLKPIPNEYIRKTLSLNSLNGFDGELIVGAPYAEDVYRKTNSAVMSHEGTPSFTYFVFDDYTASGPFAKRMAETDFVCEDIHPNVKYLRHYLVNNEEELLAYEAEQVEKGYEGIIIRNPKGLYKQGRTTMKENNAFKLKRYQDSEAVVIGMIPLMHNMNMAELDERGYIKRSTAKEGLLETDTMGALIVRDIITGVEFQIGTGFTEAERKWWYINWEMQPSLIVKYKFFPVGIKEKPRHPVYLGIRNMEVDG